MDIIFDNLGAINIGAHLASTAIAVSLIVYYLRTWSNRTQK